MASTIDLKLLLCASSIIICLCPLLACDSDEVVQETGIVLSTGEPYEPPFMPGTTTEDPPDPPFETDGDVQPSSYTCRDVIDCLAFFAIDGITIEDVDAFVSCQYDLTDEQESVHLVDLFACIGVRCGETGLCSEGQTNEELAQCLNCFTINLLASSPPGCEAEAALCQ